MSNALFTWIGRSVGTDIGEPPLLPINVREDLVHAAASLWAPNPEIGNLLSNWENTVFAFTAGARSLILRLTIARLRSLATIEAECEWIEILNTNGISVARPLRSIQGRWVETIGPNNGDTFHAVVFEKLIGKKLTPEGARDLPVDLIHSWGSLLGQMHAIACRPIACMFAERRPRWDADPLFSINSHTRKALGSALCGELDMCLGWLHGLEESRSAFGLVHADAHGRNLFLHDNAITLIDFDDAQFHWFAYDLAVAIAWTCPRRGRARERFSTLLLEGHRRVCPLAPYWYETIDAFVRVRLTLDLILAVDRISKHGPLDILLERAAALHNALRQEAPLP
jgi:Ser/Thr protein kinase RdoA (MazF antagonist)